MSSNTEALLSAPQIQEQIEGPSRFGEFIDRSKRFIGRTALSVMLATGAGAAAGAIGSAVEVNPTAAAATTTFSNDYPNLDAAVYNAATYDWWVDENGDGDKQVTPDVTDDDETMSPRGYNYRNCTDGVAYWVNKYTGVDVRGWHNAKDWDSYAPANKVYGGNTSAIEPGTIAQSDDGGGGFGHVGFVTEVTKDSNGIVTSFKAAELNKGGTGEYSLNTYNTRNSSGKFIRGGTFDWDNFIDVNGEGKGLNNEDLAASGPATPTYIPRMTFVRNDDMLFGKDTLGGIWTSETGSGWVRNNSNSQVGTIAVGGADGTTQLWVNGCGALYAKNSLGSSGWVEEAGCGSAKTAAISNTNLQLMVDYDGKVWARYGVGVGGWTYEASAGTGQAVAAGGDTQMMLSTCGAVYAKNGVGYGGWVEEMPCGSATQIDISSTGLQMVLNTCGAFYSKYGVGEAGWWAEGDCGWATQVAAGGNTHMFLSSTGGVYAKTTMGYGGWTEEAAPGTATSIAIGDTGRQMIIANDSSIFVKDSISVGGWTIQAEAGNGKAVAVS